MAIKCGQVEVAAGDSKKYSEGWERVFGKKDCNGTTVGVDTADVTDETIVKIRRVIGLDRDKEKE